MIPNRTILLVATVIGIAAVLATAAHLNTARSAFRSESARLEKLTQDVRSLEYLRTAEAHAQSGEPPEDDLLGAVRTTISHAGLQTNSFQGLSTTGDQPVRGREGYRRRAYRVQLTGLDATDLGSFLAIWREDQPLWTIERIELRHQNTAGRRQPRNAPDPGYALSLTMATIYAASPSGSLTE